MQKKIVALALVCLAAACSDKEAKPEPKGPVPVRVRAVEPLTAPGAARYSGSVEPFTRVDLAFKVGGYVRELAQVKGKGGEVRKVQEGDFVTKGTVLAAVRESDYEQRIAVANASLAEATAAQKQAQLDFDRATKLAESNTISKAEVETMGARLQTATARVEGARAHISEAQLALADCALRAPMDGVVLKRPVEVGALVAPGVLGFVLADTRQVKVVFGAPDRLIDKLKIGGTVGVAFEAIGKDYTGTITRIAPSADPRSRVFDVEAVIPNADDAIKVGMVAALKLAATVLESSTLALPLTAVVRSPRDPRGFSVFVVEGTTAKLRDVKLGDVVGNAVIVTEGLKNGDRVVSQGAQILLDGDAIRVIP